MSRSKLGPAGAAVLKRTGAAALDAVTEATPAPAFRRGGGKNQAGHKVTTVRFNPEQWRWLREHAMRRHLESGARLDASELIRELVDAAIQAEGRRR